MEFKCEFVAMGASIFVVVILVGAVSVIARNWVKVLLGQLHK